MKEIIQIHVEYYGFALVLYMIAMVLLFTGWEVTGWLCMASSILSFLRAVPEAAEEIEDLLKEE